MDSKRELSAIAPYRPQKEHAPGVSVPVNVADIIEKT
jgi:hypothetical protein